MFLSRLLDEFRSPKAKKFKLDRFLTFLLYTITKVYLGGASKLPANQYFLTRN